MRRPFTNIPLTGRSHLLATGAPMGRCHRGRRWARAWASGFVAASFSCGVASPTCARACSAARSLAQCGCMCLLISVARIGTSQRRIPAGKAGEQGDGATHRSRSRAPSTLPPRRTPGEWRERPRRASARPSGSLHAPVTTPPPPPPISSSRRRAAQPHPCSEAVVGAARAREGWGLGAAHSSPGRRRGA